MTNKRYAHLLVRVGLVASAMLAIAFGIWEILGDVPSTLKLFGRGREFSYSRWWDVLTLFVAIQGFGWAIRKALEKDDGNTQAALLISTVAGAIFASCTAMINMNLLSEWVFRLGLVASVGVSAIFGSVGVFLGGDDFDDNACGGWCVGSGIGVAAVTYVIAGLHVGYLWAFLVALVFGLLGTIVIFAIIVFMRCLRWLCSRKFLDWLKASDVK